MATYLFEIVMLSLLVVSVSTDFCEDRSIAIASGAVECKRYSVYTSRRKYTCTINCQPGYLAKPTKLIYCNSNGNRVWKVDHQGNNQQVYYGTWTADITQARCEAPTSCQDIANNDKPQHGGITCNTDNSTKTCVRTCSYPYEVTDPENREEQCSPETNYFWSHVIRRNATKMPPCEPPAKCRPLRDSDIPEHGHMDCHRKEWADTIMCILKCERGYIPKAGSEPFEFCGPTTAFIWSHLHAARNSFSRIKGCEQAPVTAEITLLVNQSCESIDVCDIQQGADILLGMLNSKLDNLRANNVHLNVSLITQRTHCETRVVDEDVEVDNALYGLWQDYVGHEQANYIDKESVANLVLKNSDQSDGAQLQVVNTPSTKSTNTPSLDAPTTTTTANQNAITVQTTVSELIFAFHFKANCKHGRCEEACAALGMPDGDTRCMILCKQNARPTSAQVRHLTTSYVGHMIEGIDISIASDIILGGHFKSLNVTTKDADDYNPSSSDASTIAQSYNYCNRHYSHCRDQC